MIPTASPTRSISFRSQLDGEVLQFLKNEKIECTMTTEAVVQVIISIADYREEGVRFYPRVFIVDDIHSCIRMLPGGERFELGTGERRGETVKSALKRCTPLAKGGWSIYIERYPDRFNYGLFTAAVQPLSLDPSLLLMFPTPNVKEIPSPILLLERFAENAVELRSNSGRCMHVHLSGSHTDLPPPSAAREAFVRAIIQDVQEKYKEPVFGFLLRVLSEALHEAHGTLGAVISAGSKRLPPFFQDAVKFPSGIDIQERVVDFETRRDVPSMARLQSLEHLIRGMIQSDGMTVFRSDARVLGFRVFLKNTGRVATSEPILGGARMRAYQNLHNRLGRGGLIAAYYQSQDGQCQCSGS